MGRRYAGPTRQVSGSDLRPGLTVVDIPGVRLRPRRGRPVTVLDRRAGWDSDPVWLLTLSDRPSRPVVLPLEQLVTVADVEGK